MNLKKWLEVTDLLAYSLFQMDTSKKKKSLDTYIELSEDQWAFIAVVEVFGGPVSIDIAGRLAPLLPGALMDMMEKSESCGLLNRSEHHYISMGQDLPLYAVKKLKKINSKKNISKIADRIIEDDLIKKIEKPLLVEIMSRAGRRIEAGEIELTLAKDALERKQFEQVRIHLENAVVNLESECEKPETGKRFIASVLQLSNTSFALGKGLLKIENFLNKALETAISIGDTRSHALLNLNLGRLYYFTNRRDDALVALSIGSDEIEELGDSDIQSQSATFLGFYSFIRGRFKEAFKHLEKANQFYETSDDILLKDPIIPVYFGYCAVYLGDFHRAIGYLDYHSRLAMERSDKALSSTIRSVLGTILALVGKSQEANIHLKKAQKDSKETSNVFGLYFSGGGISLDYFIRGEVKKSHAYLMKTLKEGTKAGLKRQFSSPWILEMLYEFHQRGFEPIPSFELKDIMDRVMNGVNCHLQGVCLRLKAKMLLGRSGAHEKIKTYLKQSKEMLFKSSDPVQTAKTLLEIAGLELIHGHREKAREIAQEARAMLGGYIEEFFPNEFRYLVENIAVLPSRELKEEDFINRYLKMIESIYPSKNQMEMLTKMLTATSQIFGAERNGLFWFPKGQFTTKPELMASSNLANIEINEPRFAQSLKLILKTFRKNNPFSEELVLKEFSLDKKFVRSVLCVPVEVKHQVWGVLYFDNSYFGNAFEFLNLSLIKRMTKHTNMVIETHLDLIKEKKRANRLSSGKSLFLEAKKGRIITQSKNVIGLLEQIDQVAKTESTILILGETGTGKELIAKRIHTNSARNNAPFIIIDSTTIPENLLESELFGHEKGSFTGADKRKIGCIEMAHQGTLFLDEIGELPFAAQAKLLRALQEKTLRRVGGTTSIATDFRLIAATNRNLKQEVEQGRFREDLFYRLNVVPFRLPPLRQRGKDAILLSEHFIHRYSKKYNFQTLKLSSEEIDNLLNYAWPGNIRELKNVIERAVILSGGEHLELGLPFSTSSLPDNPFKDKPSLDEIQRRYIRYVLEYTKGKISGPDGACGILGMKRSSFYSRMRALNFKKDTT